MRWICFTVVLEPKVEIYNWYNVNTQLLTTLLHVLPEWSLPPVFFIPMGLMVYFSLCFQYVLFCCRGAVVRKPLHCTTVLGTWVPSNVCAIACQDKKKQMALVSVLMLSLSGMAERMWMVTCEGSRAGLETDNERRARVRQDTAISATSSCQGWGTDERQLVS